MSVRGLLQVSEALQTFWGVPNACQSLQSSVTQNTLQYLYKETQESKASSKNVPYILIGTVNSTMTGICHMNEWWPIIRLCLSFFLSSVLSISSTKHMLLIYKYINECLWMETYGSTRFMDFLLHCQDNWIESISLSMRNKSNFDNGIYCPFLNMTSEQEMDGESPGECFISHDREMACYICEVLLKLTSSM